MILSAALLLTLVSGVSAGGPPRPAYGPERLALVRDVTELSLSPDGGDAAFITDITGALEVWRVAAKGGWPEQLSALGEQASAVEYSPDGGKLVFASDFGGDERPDLYLVDAAGGAVENLTSSTRAEAGPRFSPDGGRLAFTADPDEAFVFELMVMDLSDRKVRRLTREGVNLHFPVWSPDGRTIAVTRSGDDHKGELLLIDAASGAKREIPPPSAGGIIIPEAYADGGRALVCRAHNAAGFLQLYWLDPATGRGRFIGPGDWDAQRALWNGKLGVVFAQNRAGASALLRMAGPDAPVEELRSAGGWIADLDCDRAGERVAYVWGDSAHPPDVRVLDMRTRAAAQVTRSLFGGVKPEALSRGELVRYAGGDGRLVHAWYLKPPVPRLGLPAPLVVVAHGGPDSQSCDEFHPLRQSLAEAGFAVLAPNYRGSAGFGREFLEANRKDWGGGDLQDLVAGARYLASRREIDPARVGITGGSFGGYLTLMALAKTPEAWAVGVEAYGMPDLLQDYEITGERFRPWYDTQMGDPKSNVRLYHDRSAVHFLDRIRAPLLIFQGANDTNVPKAESELVFRKLRERGARVEMTVYPDEGHGFTKRANRTDYYRRTVEFFKKHLGAGAAP